MIRPKSAARTQQPLRARRAFTLVELLVVIGIIGLLVAILLPALSKAKKQANITKCAVALRELGTAMNMYAVEYKGYLPPVTLRTAAGRTYSLNDSVWPVTGTNELVYPYWFNFLQKYITKGKVGGEALDGLSIGETKNRTIVWGCPEWEGIRTTTTFGDGINRVSVGYGMNAWPTFMPDYPRAPNRFPHPSEGNYPARTRDRNLIVDFGGTISTGSFHQQKTYGKMGGERILLADGLGYFLEAGNVPVTGVTASQSVGVSYVSYADDGYLKGPVTTVDLYRHGKLAPLLPGGTLVSTTGGRIAFNALYSDGHVETKYDKKDAWRGLRMRFPN